MRTDTILDSYVVYRRATTDIDPESLNYILDDADEIRGYDFRMID